MSLISLFCIAVNFTASDTAWGMTKDALLRQVVLKILSRNLFLESVLCHFEVNVLQTIYIPCFFELKNYFLDFLEFL